MRPGFLPGDELVEASSGELLYVVVVPLPRIQSFKALDIKHKQEVVLEDADYRLQIASGQVRVRRQNKDLTAPTTQHSSEEDAASQAYVRLLNSLTLLRRRYGVSFHKAYALLLDKFKAGETPEITFLPSRAQAYRLWQRHRKGLPVYVGNSSKGNRSPRYSQDVLSTVRETAALYLQVHSKWTLLSITEYINIQLHDAGIVDKAHKVSKAFVQRVIHEELHADTGHARMHPVDAIAAKAVAGRKIRVEGIFERVEQDALHLPWLIRTPYGDSTVVYLVHAIDCCTSIPVGWHLVIGAPRTASTLACIETILFPKTPKFEALGLWYEFDIFSTPEQIIADNGPENKSERLNRLTRVGIDFVRLKGRHPHHKPFIERLNGSLKRFLETLPGSTRVDGKDGQRNPAELGDSVMTLEEMERWIVRFYYEHWVHNPLERLKHAIFQDGEDLGTTPMQRYRTLTEKLLRPMPLPISLDMWRSVVFDWQELTLSRKTGISYGRFQFRGDRLPQLISTFGETKVTVLIDPEDFRMVYVLGTDGEALVPLVNTAVSEGTPAHSFTEAQQMLEELNATSDSSSSVALRRDIFNRSAGVTTGSQKSQKAFKKSAMKPATSKDTTKRSRQHGAVLRSAGKPLPIPEPSLGHPQLGGPEDDWSAVPSLEVSDRKAKKERDT